MEAEGEGEKEKDGKMGRGLHLTNLFRVTRRPCISPVGPHERVSRGELVSHGLTKELKIHTGWWVMARRSAKRKGRRGDWGGGVGGYTSWTVSMYQFAASTRKFVRSIREERHSYITWPFGGGKRS